MTHNNDQLLIQMLQSELGICETKLHTKRAPIYRE